MEVEEREGEEDMEEVTEKDMVIEVGVEVEAGKEDHMVGTSMVVINMEEISMEDKEVMMID